MKAEVRPEPQPGARPSPDAQENNARGFSDANTLLVALIVVLAIAVGAVGAYLVFGGKNDFADREEKRELYEEYECEKARQLDEGIVASSAAIDVLADSNASPSEKETALGVQLDLRGLLESDVPLTPTPHTSRCEGWVWETRMKYLDPQKFKDFTYQDAKAAGLT